ncbi:MAG: hypothetical protein ACJA08_001359 [Cyclobacteriaceae bacterium]|jgi:hypothetical protein
MKQFLYILFILAVVGSIEVLHLLFPANKVTEAAKDADLFISNSRLYAKEHAYERSLLHLELAIKSIEDMEEKLDAEARKTVDKAIKELRLIYLEIKEHRLDNTDMNHAFTKTMNALTYAELKVTEHLIESDDYHNAMVALKSGMIHIENALKFADKGHLAYELEIYTQLDSLIDHSEMSKKEIVFELDKMMAELNYLVEE